MGLYQQWLRYQDVERSLRKTRRALEEELAQLESQLDTIFFEQLAQHEYPLQANPILSALLTTFDSPDNDTSEPSSLAIDPPLPTALGTVSQPGDEAIPLDTNFLDRLHSVFAALHPEEVELFYVVYRQWLLQEHIVDVRQRLAALQEQLGANERRIQHYRPTPIALASLVRLQANGVNDIELLDQMLERGEDWLDATMQRLDYCEQFENFLSDDYTQWCRRTLDGAFDWIDTLRMASIPGVTDTGSGAAPADPHLEVSEDTVEAEALLLQKLSTEADETDESNESNEDNQDDGSDTTLKQAAVVLRANRITRPLPPDMPEQPDTPADTTEDMSEQPETPPDTPENTPDKPCQIEDDARYSEVPLVTLASAKKHGTMRRLVGRLLRG